METSELLALKQASEEHLEKVCEKYDLTVPPENITVQFSEMFRDTNGVCFSVGNRNYRIVMSPYLYKNRSEEYYLDALEHELSHAEAYYKYGSKIDNHGDEWLSVAREMGVNRVGVSYRKPDKLNVCTECEFFEAQNLDPPAGSIEYVETCPECGSDTRMVINNPKPQHLLRLEA